jgi:hypothetical protein
VIYLEQKQKATIIAVTRRIRQGRTELVEGKVLTTKCNLYRSIWRLYAFGCSGFTADRQRHFCQLIFSLLMYSRQ